MYNWWNYSGKEKQKHPYKNLPLFHFTNHKFTGPKTSNYNYQIIPQYFAFLVNRTLNFTAFSFLFFQWLLLVADQVVRISVPRFFVGRCIPKILERPMSENISNFTSPAPLPHTILILTIPRKRAANLWALN